MSRFPSAAHLASWAGLCPGNNESAGRIGRGASRPHGPPPLTAHGVTQRPSLAVLSTFNGIKMLKPMRRLFRDVLGQ
jgi:hypothetical protein